MIYKIQYIDKLDRDNKIAANADKFLIEEQNITEGNYLLFSDIKQIGDQLQDQQDNQLTIMSAIADLYSALADKGVI